MDEENKLGTAADVITEAVPETQKAVVPTIEELQKQVAEYKVQTTIPETYDLSKLTNLQEQDSVAFSEFAKKTKLTQNQAVDVASEYSKMMQDQQIHLKEYHAKMKEDAMTSLTNAFGDQTDTKLAGANKVVTDFGGQKLHDYLDQSGLGNNVDLIQAFVKISESIGEDTHGTTSVSQKSNSTLITPTEAKKQLKEHFSNKKSRDNLFNALDPNATNDFKEIKKLAEIASQKE